MVHECTEMLTGRRGIHHLHCSVYPDQEALIETMAVRTSEQARHRAPLVLECAIYATPMRIRSGRVPLPARRTGHMGNYGRRNPREKRDARLRERRPLYPALESEDMKGARRMPWRRKPMKGAASGDTPRGGADGLRSGGARMGEPARDHALAPRAEHIGSEEATRGTETSQYPEEEKSTEIPGVAASGTGRTPKPARATRPQPCPAGVVGRATGACGAPAR